MPVHFAPGQKVQFGSSVPSGSGQDPGTWLLPAAPLLLLPGACERGHGAAWPRASGVPPGGGTGCRAMPNSMYAAPASCRAGEEP